MVLSRSENGEFYTAHLNQPVQIQVGDEVIRDGNTITVIRGGLVVAVRTFGAASVAPVVAEANELSSSVLPNIRHRELSGSNTQTEMNVSFQAGQALVRLWASWISNRHWLRTSWPTNRL